MSMLPITLTAKKTHVTYCVPTPSQSERRGRAVPGTAPRLTGAVAIRHWTRGKWKACSNRLLISPGFLPRKVSIRFENQSMSRDFRSAMAYSGYEPVDQRVVGSAGSFRSELTSPVCSMYRVPSTPYLHLFPPQGGSRSALCFRAGRWFATPPRRFHIARHSI